jgi:putative endonuclease
VDEAIWYVYAIASEVRNYIYVGLTSDVERRVSQHNGGRERTTRAYRPFRVILVEEYSSRTAARAREKELKSGWGKEFLKKRSATRERG